MGVEKMSENSDDKNFVVPDGEENESGDGEIEEKVVRRLESFLSSINCVFML